ncbi:MAG: O-antigen ligase family protein [Lachnospiraceae bacterium]|nr:O-antigen ligase family protein [Lachnospiraceae bacterium]
MSKKYYYKSKRGVSREGYREAFLRMLPALLMVGLVPLIIRQCAYKTGLETYPWFENTVASYEFFLLPKSVALTVLMFVLAAGVLLRLWKERKKIPFLKLFIPLFAYGALVFLSACFSVNRTFSFSGSYEQFETVWVLLSYVLVVYYVFLYAQSETELLVVTDAICFSATVVGLLGTLQGLGLDFMKTRLVQKLITTEDFLNAVGGKLTIVFGNRQAYATMYNPNYLGVFGSFVLPFLAMLVLFEKNKWRRIWHIADFALVTVALLSSRSRAGLIAAVAALGVAVIFCIRNLLKQWYFTIPAANFALVLVLLVNAYNDNVIFDRLKNIFAKDNVKVAEYTAQDGTVVKKTGLTELYTVQDGVVFMYNEVRAQVSLYVEGGTYGFYTVSETGEQLLMTKREEEEVFVFEYPALDGIRISPVFIGERLGFCLYAGKEWNFVYNESKGKYQYVTDFGKESDMIMAESALFKDRQSSFSHRGFIWSRTLPLLKDHIFLGSGPDTFLLAYPQEDYLMMRTNGFEHQVMTKPHSLYLQVGVQTGVLSLLCLLVFYGWYAIWCIRLYCFRNLSTKAEGLGIAAFIGSIGYMISAISNDSMVVTAPVFWGMIGLGIAANVAAGKERKQKQA